MKTNKIIIVSILVWILPIGIWAQTIEDTPSKKRSERFFIGYDAGFGFSSSRFKNYLDNVLQIRPASFYNGVGLSYKLIKDDDFELQISFAARFANSRIGSTSLNLCHLHEVIRGVYHFWQGEKAKFGAFVGLGVSQSILDYRYEPNANTSSSLPDYIARSKSLTMTQNVNISAEAGLQFQVDVPSFCPLMFYLKWVQDINSSKWRSQRNSFSDVPKHRTQILALGVMIGL